jgi:ABC-type branched-subunit amino acid transport system substrate-binding protein
MKHTWKMSPSAGNGLLYRVACCLFLLCLAIAGCQVTPPVVKVGLVAPFSGEYRELGYDVIYSARLAVREINNAGGVGGVHLALVALDDRGEAETARQMAGSLAVDPDVVVVLGHWLVDTTEAARPTYLAHGLALIEMGQPPLGTIPPENLPQDFRASYEAVTPFDEVAGPYAGSAYDAMYLVVAAIREAGSDVDRGSIGSLLPELQIQGITGSTIYQP